MRKGSGFTLIEVVMTIVVLGIIGGTLAPVITQNIRAYVATEARSQLQDKMRLAFGRLERGLRQTAAAHLSASGSTLIFVTTSVGASYVNFNSNTPKISTADCSKVRNQSPSQLERFLTNEPIATLCILYPGTTALSSYSSAELDALMVGSDLTGVSSVAVQVNGSPDSYDGALWKVTFDSETIFSSSAASSNNAVAFADYRHRVILNGSNELIWERTTASDTSFSVAISGKLLSGVSVFTPAFDLATGVLDVSLTLTDGVESISASEEIYVRN